MSSMENDARDFLLRIVKTLTAALVWLFLNVLIGIYMGWMFFYKAPTPGNYIFYAWMLASLVGLLVYFKRVWSKPLESADDRY